jgi:hypothetical protein
LDPAAPDISDTKATLQVLWNGVEKRRRREIEMRRRELEAWKCLNGNREVKEVK